MILAVDTGLATLGWAHVSRRGVVLDLGALCQPALPGEGVQAGYERRCERQVDELLRLLPAVQLIAVEALSFARSAKAVASVSLCWGMLITVAKLYEIRLWRVSPKRWQHSLLNTPARQPVDYSELARRITEHVARSGAPKARSAVAALKASERTHALDAAGIGIYTATIADTREDHA